MLRLRNRTLNRFKTGKCIPTLPIKQINSRALLSRAQLIATGTTLHVKSVKAMPISLFEIIRRKMAQIPKVVQY